MIKKLIILILAMILIVPGVIFAEKEGNGGNDWGEDEIKIVSVGDSIATGYVTDKHTTMAYPYRLDKFLRGPFKVNFKDWGVTGLSFADLLQGNINLTNETAPDPEFALMVQDLKEADIITVSILGNDLLEIALRYAADYPNVDMVGLNNEVGLLMTTLESNWLLSFEWLNQNTSAEVYVLNIYNPLREDVHGYLYLAVDEIISNINTIIDYHSYDRYTVIDIYTAFEEYKASGDKVTYFYSKRLPMNPHPTQEGQNIMFDLFKSAMESGSY